MPKSGRDSLCAAMNCVEAHQAIGVLECFVIWEKEMSKEPFINTTAIRYGHGIVLAIHECDLLDLVSILDSGIRRKKIQLAYCKEREEKTLTEIVEEQIRTGEEIYNILEPLIEVPSKEKIEKICRNIIERND